MTVVPPQLRDRLVPSVEGDPQSTVDDMAHYALAGLTALRARYATPRTAEGVKPPSRAARGRGEDRSRTPVR